MDRCDPRMHRDYMRDPKEKIDFVATPGGVVETPGPRSETNTEDRKFIKGSSNSDSEPHTGGDDDDYEPGDFEFEERVDNIDKGDGRKGLSSWARITWVTWFSSPTQSSHTNWRWCGRGHTKWSTPTASLSL